MNIKVLGSGCASCRRMYNDVNRIIASNGWQNIEVEYVQDIQRIIAYGVMTTPALVINEKVAMIGNHGTAKIEQVLRAGNAG